MNDKHARLVDRLLERTERGAIDWRPGFAEGEFVVDLPTTSIAIKAIGRSRDSAPATIMLTLFDSTGRAVDSFSDGDLALAGDGPAHAEKARTLYRLAQRASLEAERVLDEALGALADGLGA